MDFACFANQGWKLQFCGGLAKLEEEQEHKHQVLTHNMMLVVQSSKTGKIVLTEEDNRSQQFICQPTLLNISYFLLKHIF